MYPVLFNLGPLTVKTYGLFLAMSFVFGILLAVKRGESRGVGSKDILDLCFTIMVASIIGSRLFFVLTHLSEYLSNPLRIFSIWEGGLSMFGGIVLALVASKFFANRRGLSFALLGDIVSPSIVLGTALTRIGCFMNGCCFGVPTESSFGVVFPAYCAAGSVFPGVAIHPTQLYSSLMAFIILIVILLVDRTRRREGFLFGLTFILYATGRIIIDQVRYYDEGAFLTHAGLSITYNEIIAATLILTGLYFMFVRR